MGDEPQPLGHGRHQAEGHERVERVVAAGLQPAVRRRRVVGEPHPVEPQLLGPGGEADDRLLADQLRAVGVGDERVGDEVAHHRPGHGREPSLSAAESHDHHRVPLVVVSAPPPPPPPHGPQLADH